jgi:hypothetical protein
LSVLYREWPLEKCNRCSAEDCLLAPELGDPLSKISPTRVGDEAVQAEKLGKKPRENRWLKKWAPLFSNDSPWTAEEWRSSALAWELRPLPRTDVLLRVKYPCNRKVEVSCWLCELTLS